jgi:pimeloyl-ACP methyl ester carboxylesterase
MTQALDTDLNAHKVLNLMSVTSGHGTKAMLAFHGIGQDHRCFMPLVEVLKDQYTFYLFDLPFHGQSPPLASEKLSMSDWAAIVEQFLREKCLSDFSVMGFSMGGKFALATLQLFGPRVQSCWLLAPDGITESPWYWLATRFWLSKKLFHFFISNVARFHQLAKPLVAVGLVAKSAVKFAEATLSTPAQRERVYRSWIGFSSIRADMKKIAQIVEQNKTDVRLFLGKYDALLPLHYADPLAKRLPNFKPIVLKTGHHRLIEKVAEWVSSSIKNG